MEIFTITFHHELDKYAFRKPIKIKSDIVKKIEPIFKSKSTGKDSEWIKIFNEAMAKTVARVKNLNKLKPIVRS